MKVIHFKYYYTFCLYLLFNQIVYSQKCELAPIYLNKMPSCNDAPYILQFEDNFDGNCIDQGKWIIETGVPRDSAFKKQKAWHTAQNIDVSNGTLKISAKKYAEPYTGTWYIDWSTIPWKYKTSDFNYSTGEIKSAETFFQGKYETRCRLPKGIGFWPAFWTFGGSVWNEIDIFEIYGDQIDAYTCNVHHDFDHVNDGNSNSDCSFIQENVTDFSEWHIFTCIFESDKIIWQIDGITVRKLYRFMTITKHPISCKDNIAQGTYSQAKSFPLEKMNIILNLAIQTGEYTPNEQTKFPGIFEVDYVRFYKRSTTALCDNRPKTVEFVNSGIPIQIVKSSETLTISGSQQIDAGQTVILKSAEISLNKGFTVEKNATLILTPNDDCSKSPICE